MCPSTQSLTTGIASIVPEPYRNYHAVDWKAFCEHLAQQLAQIPRPQMLQNNTQFHGAIARLTEAIQATTIAVVPLAKLTQHSRHWWNQDLLVLKKKLNRLNNQSYKFRALADHPIHAEHKEARNRYSDAIKHAKTEHWQEFLEGAQGPDIWMAN